MDRTERPWWAPDAQGFLAAAIVVICGTALFVRMFRTSTVDDKMLDTMITIFFSTCLVTVYQFSFGSSRGSQTKDEKQDKILDKLVPPPAPVIVTVPTVTSTSWWSKLTDAEKATITASTNPRVQAIVVAATAGTATLDDLNYLVTVSLLSQGRATAITAP